MGPQVSPDSLFRAQVAPRPPATIIGDDRSSGGFQEYLNSARSTGNRPVSIGPQSPSPPVHRRPKETDPAALSPNDPPTPKDPRDARPVSRTDTSNSDGESDKPAAIDAVPKVDATDQPVQPAVDTASIQVALQQPGQVVFDDSANNSKPAAETIAATIPTETGNTQTADSAIVQPTNGQVALPQGPIESEGTRQAGTIDGKSAKQPRIPAASQAQQALDEFDTTETVSASKSASSAKREQSDEAQPVSDRSSEDERITNKAAANVQRPLQKMASDSLRHVPSAVTASYAAEVSEPNRIQALRASAKPVAANESIADRKIEIDEAKLSHGESEARNNLRPVIAGSETGKNPFSSNQEPRGNGRLSTDFTEVKSVSIRTGDGDSAAASIGRFLVSTDSSSVGVDAAAPSNAAPATHVSAPSAFSVRAPAVAAQPASPVANILTASVDATNPAELAARVLTANAGASGQHRATLQLDPPELGQLRIDIRLHEQGLMMRVDADNAVAAKLIESRLPELRDALAMHGIRVDRADVVVRSPDTGDANAHTDSHRSSTDSGAHGQQQFASSDDGRGAQTPPERQSWAGDIAAASVAAASDLDADSARPEQMRIGTATERYVNLVA